MTLVSVVRLSVFLTYIISVCPFSSLNDKPGHGIDKHNAVLNTMMSRRRILSFGASAVAFVGVVGPASAFANKISDKYDDRPKRKGPQVSVRYYSVM